MSAGSCDDASGAIRNIDDEFTTAGFSEIFLGGGRARPAAPPSHRFGGMFADWRIMFFVRCVCISEWPCRVLESASRAAMLRALFAMPPRARGAPSRSEGPGMVGLSGLRVGSV